MEKGVGRGPLIPGRKGGSGGKAGFQFRKAGYSKGAGALNRFPPLGTQEETFSFSPGALAWGQNGSFRPRGRDSGPKPGFSGTFGGGTPNLAHPGGIAVALGGPKEAFCPGLFGKIWGPGRPKVHLGPRLGILVGPPRGGCWTRRKISRPFFGSWASREKARVFRRERGANYRPPL